MSAGTKTLSGVAGPLVLWLLLQLLAVLLSAMHVPLWTNFPRPPEDLALDVLLVVDATLITLLFPSLLNDWYRATLIMASTPPLVAVATLLAAPVPAARVFLATAYLLVWMTALTLCSRASACARAPRAAMLVATLASLLALGEVVLSYLRGTNGAHSVWIVGPIRGELMQLHAERTTAARAWLPLAAALLLAAMFAVISNHFAKRNSRQVIHSHEHDFGG